MVLEAADGEGEVHGKKQGQGHPKKDRQGEETGGVLTEEGDGGHSRLRLR